MHILSIGFITPFWQAFNGALLGTAMGGVVAVYIGYLLNRRSSSIEESYKIISNMLSEEMTEKKKYTLYQYKRFGAESVLKSNSGSKHELKTKSNIVWLLNYYDIVCHSMSSKLVDKNQIKDTVWQLMKSDHDAFENFIQLYDDASLEYQRPLFPSLRNYRCKWG